MTLWMLVYQLILTLLLPFGFLFWAIKALTDGRYRDGAAERLGLWPRSENGAIWIHGASMGEVMAVAPFVRALIDREVPLLMTATSRTGKKQAQEILGASGLARYLPVDHLLFLWLAFSSFRPSALIIVETELWPGLIFTARARGVPLVIVSGRISDRTFPRYLKFGRFVKPLLNSAARILAQSPMDAERYLALGADREKVVVGGNMKFDLPPMPTSDPTQVSLRRARAGGWRVMVGGSVHPGEARMVFEGAKIINESGLKLGLVVAPRHLEKIEEIERELKETGGAPVRWSSLSPPLEASIMESFSAKKTIVVDRVGLLARLYGGSEVAFVGGSMVPVGGHNLLEPLRWGVPAIFGPYMTSAPDVKDEVLRRGLGLMVNGSDGLAKAALSYFNDEKTRERVKRDSESFFEDNRGALLKAVEAVGAAIKAGRQSVGS